ncbi:hypothetical protein J5N97_018410 [Dioscorea zingiberensis]|uniref:Uncharacterized protein n=1 Tax=Dioscorea zingiberensis TaxID=325984 RepID=A0A9D5CN88_9LILI|nr:hypothetical protein J5N97_018410 [Dioscorea zingiberensis]
MSKFRLEGKVAIVTGGASGIGEATARLFVLNGAYVIIADIQDELGGSVVKSIGAEKCTYKHCDVTDEEQVEETVQYTVRTHGRLDIMFSNAGIMDPMMSILNLDLADYDRVMAVNARGAVSAIKHAARAMVRHGTKGSIICTGSVAACQAGNGTVAYTVSKHAALGLVRAAAGEVGRFGIRVNCVSPSGVATPLACGVFGGSSQDEVEAGCAAVANLKGVVLKASHVAEAVLFLASDESSFMSGHNLVIDGDARDSDSIKISHKETQSHNTESDILKRNGNQENCCHDAEAVDFRRDFCSNKAMFTEIISSMISRVNVSGKQSS